METRKILTILVLRSELLRRVALVLALGLMVCQANIGEAADIGSAFTYQGRLLDVNSPADGLYDFMFTLYDSNDACDLMAGPIEVDDLDVIEGYFTTELDFGEVFDGNDLWLEIGVRPGELTEPEDYTFLGPLVELMPAPHSIYAKIAGSDSDWMISGDDMYSIPTGNVGVGESNPLAKLHVAGNVILEGASPVLLSLSDLVGAGDVGVEFTTSLDGSKKWAMMRDGTSGGFLIQESFPYPPFLGGTLFMESGTGNVGIGTKYPEKLLQIVNKEGGYDGLGITLDPHGGGFAGGTTWDIDNDDGAFKLTESRALPGYPKTRLTILEGNVGIGTTEPSHKLNVIGDANITGSLYAGTGSTVLFVDDGNDKVGIGTTNPRATLTINDNITNIYPGVPGLMIGNNGNSAIWVGKDSDNYGAFEWINPYLRIWSENEVRFALGGQQDKIVFDSGGNVGIGAPAPSYKLEVNGTLYANTVDTGQGNYELYAMNQNVRTSDNTTFNRVHIADYGTALGGFHVGSTSDPGADNLRVDGQVYIPNMDNAAVATAYEVLWQSDKLVKGNISSSSARYKQDIRPLRDDFDRILQAQCRSFTFKENGQEAIGFIAEEFDALGLDNLVIYREGRPDAIQYDKVPLYLLEVLKDQAQTTEQLKAENESLTERVEALERTVQQLVKMKEVQL